MKQKFLTCMIIFITCLLFSVLLCGTTYAATNYNSKIAYEENEDGTLSVLATSTEIEGEVVIPSTINGKTVTAVAEKGFMNCHNITSVTIPATVTALEDNAFSCDSSITSVTFEGDGLTKIGFGCFDYCEKIVEFDIPSTVTEIGESAFEHCYSLKEIVIPEGVTVIEPFTFQVCHALEKVTIEGNVTEIGRIAFGSCYKLTEINLPESLTTIGAHAFYETNLTYVYLSKNVTIIGEDDYYDTQDPFELDSWGEAEGNSRDNFVIYGYSGTTAETFAKEYGYTFVECVPLTDVSFYGWYYDSVDYMYENGYMTGYSGTTKFGINNTMKRSELVTILYRMSGSPSVSSSSKFTDVTDSSKYYYNAVIWAASNDIVTGYGNTGLFKPDKEITREELAVVIYRYAKYKGVDVSKTGSLNSFADSSSVSSWAQTEVQWVIGQSIITGIEKSGKMYIQPSGNATRAQAATMIYRYTNVE